MKTITSLLILLIAISSSYSQSTKKPSWNEETGIIMLKGKEYSHMEKKPSKVITGSNYWIRNKEGTVIIQFIYETYTYFKKPDDCYKCDPEEITAFRERVIFPETGSYVHLKVTAFGFGKKSVMKVLSKNEIIDENQNLDWEKATMYIQEKQGELFQLKDPGPSSTPVVIVNNEIFQDDVIIGKFKKREMESHFIYNVYSNDGDKVVTAKIEKNDPFEWILTDKEGNKTEVLYEDDNDGIKILTYLAKKGILTK